MDHIALSELSVIIGKTLTDHLSPSYWVVAEIGDLKVNQKGHCYLELIEKEGDEIKSKIRGTIWSFTYRKLGAWFERFTGEPLREGLKILFNATVQFHPIYGLSLNIRDIDAQFTLGERVKRRFEVIDRLKEEGVFDMNRETTLPLVPQYVAVISSPTAAGWEDFTNQLWNNENGYQFKTDLYPATMQGSEASRSIIEAMLKVHEQIDQYDMLVLIRGGGASSDLDCFDSYDLSSHLAQFPIPVITGIGHERDETVADLVAHTKLKTPTAVAEFLISGMNAFEEKLRMALDRMIAKISHFQQMENNRLERITRQVSQAHAFQISRRTSELDNLRHKLVLRLDLQLERLAYRLDNTRGRLTKSANEFVERHSKILDRHENSVHLLDPQKVFRRGYTLTLIGDQLLRDVKKLNEGASIRTLDASREIDSTITEIKNKGK